MGDKLKKLIIKKPKKFDKNKSIMRNSKIKNKGQELWNKAKKIILWKHAFIKTTLFLPNRWPTYYSKAKGLYDLGFTRK